MAQVLIASIFLLNLTSAYGQKKDTIRIYRYEAGLIQFELTVKNYHEFTFYNNRNRDTLNGSLGMDAGRYSLYFDTSKLNKQRKRACAEIQKSIQMIWNKEANAYLIGISYDSDRWFFLDTAGLSKNITGQYFISDGYGGCNIMIHQNGKIVFQSFSDVGATEPADTARWISKGKMIILRGDSYLDRWYTNEKRFFHLPYLLIGKKVKKERLFYTETYTYFVKEEN